MQQLSKRIFGLDIVRALAICLVVLSHITYLISVETSSKLITGIRVLGAIGVDLFFVLSGFLIGNIILKITDKQQVTLHDLFTFLKRRWLRTLPAYYVVLIVNILLLFSLKVNVVEGVNVLDYLFFIQNFTSKHPDFFTEAWSLSVEEYAYLTFPVLLFLSLLITKIKPRKVFLWTLILSLISLFLLKLQYYNSVSVLSYKDWSQSFRKVVIYRLDAIYLGFVLIYCYRQFNSFFKANRVVLALLGLLLFSIIHVFVFYYSIQPQTHLGFYVFIYLTVIIISLGLTFPFAIDLKLKNTIFITLIEYISKRSYAIYLVNYSIVLLNVKAITYPINKMIMILIYLLVSIVLAELLYRFVEQPILRYRNKILPNE